jgi:hypothetical protein
VVVHGSVQSDVGSLMELPAGTNYMAYGTCSRGYNYGWSVRSGYWSCRGTSFSGNAFRVYRAHSGQEPEMYRDAMLPEDADGTTELLFQVYTYRYSNSDKAAMVVDAYDADSNLLQASLVSESQPANLKGSWSLLKRVVAPPAGTRRLRVRLQADVETLYTHIYVATTEEAVYDADKGYTTRRYMSADNGDVTIRTLEGNPCEEHDSCEACAAAASCGWSTAGSICLPGNATGPQTGRVCSWVSEAGECPAACSSYTDRASCMARPKGTVLPSEVRHSCLWCPTSGCQNLAADACSEDATLVWTGAVSSRLDVADNWLPKRAPTASDTLLISVEEDVSLYTADDTSVLEVKAIHVVDAGGSIRLYVQQPLKLSGPEASTLSRTYVYLYSKGRLETARDLVLPFPVETIQTSTLAGPGNFIIEGRFATRSGTQLRLDGTKAFLRGGSYFERRYGMTHVQMLNGGELVFDEGPEHILPGYRDYFRGGKITNKGHMVLTYSSYETTLDGFDNQGVVELQNDAGVTFTGASSLSGEFRLTTTNSRVYLSGSSGVQHVIEAGARFVGSGYLGLGDRSATEVKPGAVLAMRMVYGNGGDIELSADNANPETGRLPYLYTYSSYSNIVIGGDKPAVVNALNVRSGYITTNVNTTVASGFYLQGGRLNGDGEVTVQATANMYMSSGYLQGSRRVVVEEGSNMRLYGSWYIQEATLELRGDTYMVDNFRLYINGNGRLLNKGSLLMHRTSSAYFYCSGSCGTVENQGNMTMAFYSSGNVLYSQVVFENSGHFVVERGQIEMQRGGTLGGHVQIESAGSVEARGGTVTQPADGIISGRGYLSAYYGTALLHGSLGVRALYAWYRGYITVHPAADASNVTTQVDYLRVGSGSSGGNIYIERAMEVQRLRMEAGSIVLRHHELNVTGMVELMYYGRLYIDNDRVEMRTNTWRWTGGYINGAKTSNHLHLWASAPISLLGTSTYYIDRTQVHLYDTMSAAVRAPNFYIQSGASLTVEDGAEFRCLGRCVFSGSSTLHIKKGGLFNIAGRPSESGGASLGVRTIVDEGGEMVSTVNKVAFHSGTTIAGRLTLPEQQGNLELRGQNIENHFTNTSSITTLRLTLVATSYYSNGKFALVESQDLSIGELYCSSTYSRYSRAIKFAPSAQMKGLRAISDPSGYCTVQLPESDLVLDRAVVGNSLVLATANSSITTEELLLRGSITGPGRLTARHVSWLSGGFRNIDVQLGETSIFSSSVYLTSGSTVNLTRGATYLSSSTSALLDLDGASRLTLPRNATLTLAVSTTIGGDADDTFVADGTVEFVRTSSVNYIQSRMELAGDVRLADAAYLEMRELDMAEGGHVQLAGPTTRLRFVSRTSTVAEGARISGGRLELNGGGLSVPADSLSLEQAIVYSGVMEVRPASDRALGAVNFAKRLTLQGGDVQMDARVLLPTLVMASSSSDLRVGRIGFVTIALSFAFQDGNIHAPRLQRCIKVDGELVLSSGATKYIYGGTVEVQGSMAWTQGNVYVYSGARLHVLKGGVFNVMSTATMSSNSDSSVVVDGICNVAVCGKTAQLSVPLNVTGMLNIRGAVRLSKGGSFSEAAQVVFISDEATLQNSGGITTVASFDSFFGPGRVTITNSGHLAAAGGKLRQPMILQDSAQLEASSGTVTLAAGLRWTSGDVRQGPGLVRVEGDAGDSSSLWTGGYCRGGLVWAGQVVISGSDTKYVYGAMSVGKGGIAQHVRGTVSVSSTGKFVVRDGGLLVGEPQGATRMSASAGRFLNLGTVSVVAVAEPYEIYGLSNYGRLVPLVGTTRLMGNTEFTVTSHVKGAGILRASSDVVMAGEFNMVLPGNFFCDSCNMLVREYVTVGGAARGTNVRVSHDKNLCPERDSFTGAGLMGPACPDPVLNFDGDAEFTCSGTCSFNHNVRVVNRGRLHMSEGTLQMTGHIENRGKATFSDMSLTDYRWDSYQPTMSNEGKGELVLEAPVRSSTAETLSVEAKLTNMDSAVVRVKGDKRAYLECFEQVAGSSAATAAESPKLSVDVADGLRTSTSSSCYTVWARGGEVMGSGRILSHLALEGGAVLIPGPGTLTVDKSVSLSNSTLVTMLRGAELGDSLAVGEGLTLAGQDTILSVPVLEDYEEDGLEDSRFVPVTHAGGLTGSFARVEAPAGMVANLTATNEQHILELQLGTEE